MVINPLKYQSYVKKSVVNKNKILLIPVKGWYSIPRIKYVLKFYQLQVTF